VGGEEVCVGLAEGPGGSEDWRNVVWASSNSFSAYGLYDLCMPKFDCSFVSEVLVRITISYKYSPITSCLETRDTCTFQSKNNFVSSQLVYITIVVTL
jgi:hypothetical protein